MMERLQIGDTDHAAPPGADGAAPQFKPDHKHPTAAIDGDSGC